MALTFIGSASNWNGFLLAIDVVYNTGNPYPSYLTRMYVTGASLQTRDLLPNLMIYQFLSVYSMGTETRRSPEQYIPPVQEPYQYIIFRASEVKDLSVEDPAQGPTRRTAHDDPAVIAASAPMSFNPYNAQASFPPGPGPQPNSQVPQQQQQQPQSQQQQQQPYPTRQLNGSSTQSQNSRNNASGQSAGNGRRNGSVNSATASMETVERALGDLRLNTGGQRGGRRGGRDIKAGDLRVPTADFDFQSSNARFDKTALAPPGKPIKSVDVDEDKADASEEEEGEVKAKEDDTAYDPKKSFFDQLSSSAAHPMLNGAAGGRGRGRGGRSRREEEREKNVATFGEPGGVGLMGPGAYVGGYGRRGGRPRRGGAPVVTR